MNTVATHLHSDDMAWVPGGTFRMGSDRFYREEAPVREVEVDGFWIERHPVTVREFHAFVRDTGHQTVAERAPTQQDYPDADPALLVAGSLVFKRPPGPVPLDDHQRWWGYVPGADWRHPEGPAAPLAARGRHPVTHVAWEDASAYAAWAGKELPTEAEWEFAARGGIDGALFAWGDQEKPGGRLMANHWQGTFPHHNTGAAGWVGTSPVGTFPANGYGLHDVTGNVWEWTADLFAAEPGERACCAPPTMPGEFPRRVIKGGSHLCAPNYCLRYRPAARQGESVDTSTSHIGFRCVSRTPAP